MGVCGQDNNCTYEYKPEISGLLGYQLEFTDKVPKFSSMSVKSGDIIAFSVFFVDNDAKRPHSGLSSTCGDDATYVPVNHEDAKYKVTFSITSNHASFDMIDVNKKIQEAKIRKSKQQSGIVNYSAGNAILLIKESFIGGSIIVNVTVQDLTKLCCGDNGNIKDPTITYSWTLNHGNSGFCNVESFTSDPSNQISGQDEWRTHNWNGSAFEPLTYTYNLTTTSTNFDNSIVTEIFGAPTNGDFFEIEDLKSFKQYDDIVDALEKIFSDYVGLPVTWYFSGGTTTSNTFDDMHSALSKSLKTKFKKRDKIGFEVAQEYFSCDQLLGTVTMKKKLEKLNNADTNGNKFIPKTKKEHSF